MTTAIQVDQKTIDSIFHFEGWIEGYGTITDTIRLNTSQDHDKNYSRVCVQDIVDTVRYLVENNLILKARNILESDNAPVSLDYKIPLKSDPHKQGRTVPHLHLELSRNEDASQIHGRLKYYEAGNWHYFLLFNIKSNNQQKTGYLPKTSV